MVRHLSIAVTVVGVVAVSGAAAQQSAPGRSFKECRNCPEMVVIPAGSFMMGSPAGEPERRENEPQHKVTISRSVCHRQD